MRRLVLGAGFIGITLLAVTAASAQQNCVRDAYGRVICGQPLGDGYDDDGPPPGRYYGPPVRRDYAPAPRYYRNDENRPPRPTMGRNGQISCGNPNYTWQDGACRPYSGR